jgi:hypothetical protein
MDEEQIEMYDPEAPAFADISPEKSPTCEQVDMWRLKFGEVYATPMDDVYYVWRTLTRFEYKELLQIKSDPMFREETICEYCVLWPEGYNSAVMKQGKAGIPSLLSEQILDKSGFLPNGEIKKL